REGWGIETLTTVIRDAIDWNMYPKASSAAFFQGVKDFLVAEKETGQSLSTVDELYRKFMKLRQTHIYSTYEHLGEFEICLGQVESLGLIRRLGSGNLILLQPKLLNV